MLQGDILTLNASGLRDLGDVLKAAGIPDDMTVEQPLKLRGSLLQEFEVVSGGRGSSKCLIAGSKDDKGALSHQQHSLVVQDTGQAGVFNSCRKVAQAQLFCRLREALGPGIFLGLAEA